jgi:hypothetical protein
MPEKRDRICQAGCWWQRARAASESSIRGRREEVDSIDTNRVDHTDLANHVANKFLRQLLVVK